MKTVFPANRVAAIAAFLTSLGTAIAGIEGSLSGKWQNTAATAVGVIGAVVTCLHFMTGSVKYDQLVGPTPAQLKADPGTPTEYPADDEELGSTPPSSVPPEDN